VLFSARKRKCTEATKYHTKYDARSSLVADEV
jgi:hypothetical protein